VPVLRPFRALRFDVASDRLSDVLSPPYDIISPARRLELLEQDPLNAVRIELPADIGTGDADDYRGAARTVAEWRSDSILIKDRRPTITVHQMSWQEPDGSTSSCTGVFVRLRLEDFGPGAGVLPHERTMSGPKEDRYQLLRATGLNTSPIVFVAGSDPADTSAGIAKLTDRPADSEATTADGITHRLWVCPTDDPGLPGNVEAPAGRTNVDTDDAAGALLRLLAAQPITIADGHHRYETALRYRDERGANRACESDPAWDYLLALIYPLDQSPRALPTHRVLRGEPSGGMLMAALDGPFAVEPVADRAVLLERMAHAPPFAAGTTGTGRLGVFSGGQAAVLTVDPTRIDALLDPAISPASRGLDVNALTAVIERAYGGDTRALAAQDRLSYIKDAGEATRMVDDGEAHSAFLLDPMPPAAISLVAEAGEVMPQKSTYFHPKAPTGLLFSPLEW
jgi:uncharacterized protein (DUF1015 family)